MYKKLSFVLLAVMLVASPIAAQVKSDIEKELEKIGLQNVAEEISGVDVYMVYATPYNFMGRVLYEGLDEAYLVPEAMEKLKKANELLRKKRMDLHLVVYDAARPRSIQEQMWKVVDNTDLEDYVANPYKSGGGAHNYGVAVDVSLVDCTGHPIPMGSEYDYFGDRSRVDMEAVMPLTSLEKYEKMCPSMTIASHLLARKACIMSMSVSILITSTSG